MKEDAGWAKRQVERELEREESLRMMKDEDRWPRWPSLPLKSRTKMEKGETSPLLGLLYAGSGPKVFLGNMYLPVGPQKDQEGTVYDSFEAIVEDGWVVD